MRVLDLDALLGEQFPRASFHDSHLESITIDLVGGVARLGFAIPTDWDDPDYPMPHGILEFRNLHAFAVETPGAKDKGPPRGLEISDDGPLPNPRVETELKMPTGLPDEAFCHYFFARNTNSFLLFAADVAVFTWSRDIPIVEGDRQDI